MVHMNDQLSNKRKIDDTVNNGVGRIDNSQLAHKAARKAHEEILTRKDLHSLFKGDAMSTYDLVARVEALVPSARRRGSPFWSRVQIRFLAEDDVLIMTEWVTKHVSATASAAYGMDKGQLQDRNTWKPSTRRGWIWWGVQLDECVVGAICLSGVSAIDKDGVPSGYNAKGGNSKPVYKNLADFNWLKSDEGLSEKQRVQAKGVMTYAMQCIIDWTMHAEPKLNGILVVVRTEPKQNKTEKKETCEKRSEYSDRSIKLATIGLRMEVGTTFEMKHETKYENATTCLMTREQYEKLRNDAYHL